MQKPVVNPTSLGDENQPSNTHIAARPSATTTASPDAILIMRFTARAEPSSKVAWICQTRHAAK